MGIQLTWLSRASWFKIRTPETLLHIDPGYTGYFRNQGISPAELVEKADVILITHPHKDHLQPLALEMITDEETRIFAPRTCADRIEGKFHIIKPGDEFTAGDLAVKVVDAYNTPQGRSTRKVHHQGDFVGYLVTTAGKTIYHAGDTDLIPQMQQLGQVDAALLPIGGKFTMDWEEAVMAVCAIRPRFVLPMHRSDADPQDFRLRVEAETDAKVMLLNLGETFHLD